MERLDASVKEVDIKASDVSTYAEEITEGLREEIISLIDTSVVNYVNTKFEQAEDDIETLNTSLSAKLNEYEEQNASEHTALYSYIDSSIAALSSKLDNFDASVTEHIEFLETTDSSLNARINALGEYVDINVESIASDISTLNDNIATLDDNINELDENVQSSVETLDASIRELFDAINKISVKLGLDKIPDVSIDIIPTIIENIENIVDEELEWRILDGSQSYDPSWRSENVNNNNMISNNTTMNSNNMDGATIDGNDDSVQQNSSQVVDSGNGHFNSLWRNLGS